MREIIKSEAVESQEEEGAQLYTQTPHVQSVVLYICTYNSEYREHLQIGPVYCAEVEH